MRWMVAQSGLVLLPDLAARRPLVAQRRDQPHPQSNQNPASLGRDRLPHLPPRRFAALVFLVLPPGQAVAFLAVLLAVFGLYMGSSFAPNHIGMPLVSAKLKLDFLRRQVLMSRNISGGPLISVFMGGLNYQIEHHLFPSMARPHLRKARPLVAAYCAAQGVPYTRTSLWQSYRIVIGYLNTVGLRGKDPSSARSSLNAEPSSQCPAPLRSKANGVAKPS
jgi:Fatty acid desaturase